MGKLWKKITENLQLTFTTFAIIATLIGGCITAYTWYVHVSDIVTDYPILKHKIRVLENKMSGRDTTNVAYLTKFRFTLFTQKYTNDFNSFYYYKFPYGQWGTANNN